MLKILRFFPFGHILLKLQLCIFKYPVGENIYDIHARFSVVDRIVNHRGQLLPELRYLRLRGDDKEIITVFFAGCDRTPAFGCNLYGGLSVVLSVVINTNNGEIALQIPYSDFYRTILSGYYSVLPRFNLGTVLNVKWNLNHSYYY